MHNYAKIIWNGRLSCKCFGFIQHIKQKAASLVNTVSVIAKKSYPELLLYMYTS